MKKLFFFLLLFFFSISVALSQAPAIDSLQQLLRTTKNDTSRIAILNKLSTAVRRSDINQSLNYSQQAYQLAEKMRLPLSMANTLNALGLIYKDQGKYPEALSCYFKALDLQERNGGDEKSISTCFNNIGIVFFRQSDYDKAISYYLKSLEIKEKINDKAGMADSYNNIGIVYAERKEHEKALDYLLKSLKLKEDMGEGKRLATAYANIGILYEETGQLEKALEFQEKALELKRKNQDKNAIATSYNNIGKVYHKRGDYRKAVDYQLLALNTARSNAYREIIKNSYKDLSQAYESLKNIDSAFHFFKLYVEEKDTLMNKEGLEKIAELQTAYETEKKAKAIELLKKEGELQSLLLNNQQLELKKQQSEAEQKNVFISLLTKDKQLKEAELSHQKLNSEKREKEIKLLNQQKEFQDLELKKNVAERNLLMTGLGLVLALAGVSYKSYRGKRKANHLLAHKNAEIEEKQKEILDSIRYAKRIQAAVLPPIRKVKEHLPDSFIIYKPKDIVAGDFYWLEEKDGKILLAAADCTGHGVPGAMVSVICNNGLNRAVREHGLTEPGKILDRTREIVIQEFEKSEEDVKDGMDISLCSFHGKELQWAGANNPLWIIKAGLPAVMEIKPDKQPIGKYAERKSFTTHAIDLQKGDIVYLFTDGYADQFGGEKGKKFKYAKLKELLLSIRDKNMEQQKEILNETFETWRGKLEQIDDVCIIGVRI